MYKTFSHLFSLVGTAIVLTALLASCGEKENLTPNPNNPPAQILPQKAFTITVCEEEPGVDKDSTYRFFAEIRGGAPDGKVTFTKVCGVDKNGSNKKVFDTTPDVVELVLTPWNSISFEFTADVNAFSSTDIIDVKKTSDLKHYVLTAKKSGGSIDTGWGTGEGGGEGRGRTVQSLEEGYSDISFWNGDRETAVVIRVRTANHIDVEGFEFALDGKKYMLVEQPVKTVGKNLSAECYLCKLPCIARPDDEYYIKGKKDYKTEDIYPPEKFSTIEFLGTVPRNATPDNKIAQHVDALSFSIPEFSADYYIAHYWNKANNPEFRWMPFYERSTLDSYNSPGALMNYYKVPVYPADLRARKGKIFNINFREFIGSNYHYAQHYYFRYTVQDGQRAWWGLIQNLFFGQN